MSVYKNLTRLYTIFNKGLVPNTISALRTRLFKFPEASSLLSNKFHTTVRNQDLMEFFDEANFGKNEVRVGRSWKLDELRIKSNTDLHKLWFVLLKERNMLLTLEHECKEKFAIMPNPERLDKVEESMKNLETVVRERNRAYYQLETGETGEQEVVNDHSGFGLPYKRKLEEHYVEKQYDLLYKKRSIARHRMVFDRDVVWFLKRFNERKKQQELRAYKKKFAYVCSLIREFDNIDEEALKAEFPDIDIEEAKQDPRSRGARLNMY